MHDITQLQGIIKNKKKKKRMHWLGLWLRNRASRRRVQRPNYWRRVC